jgi:hypothetical protein
VGYDANVSLVEGYRRFERPAVFMFRVEDKGRGFVRNEGTKLRHCMVSQHTVEHSVRCMVSQHTVEHSVRSVCIRMSLSVKFRRNM